MKLSWSQFEQTTIQMPLPHPGLAAWLAKELAIPTPPRQARAQPARTVTWDGQEVRQPERWNVSFSAPRRFISGEYWVGGKVAFAVPAVQ